MAERFRGSIPQKVDAKGRVSVPASFRRVIEACDPRFGPDKRPEILIYFGDHRRAYVECFTMQAANEIDEQIDMMPRGTPERARMEDLFYSNSQTFTVDDDGRIILPQFLRDRIRLGAEAYFVATGDRFRIWDAGLYAAEGNRATTSWLDAQPDDFDPFSVLPPLPRPDQPKSGAS